MSTMIILSIAGWLLHVLQKIARARGVSGEQFMLARFVGDNATYIISGLVAAEAMVYMLPEAELSKMTAFLVGYGSQGLLRDLLKKNTWHGIIGNKKDKK